jgi:hypothetical protein
MPGKLFGKILCKSSNATGAKGQHNIAILD